jgi:hypothetical protein
MAILDNDGDLDLVVNNVNMESFIYRNNSQKIEQPFCESKTKGDGQNKFAVGSVVELFSGKEILRLKIEFLRAVQSSIDYGDFWNGTIDSYR